MVLKHAEITQVPGWLVEAAAADAGEGGANLRGVDVGAHA
ncbi:MAG: hypothetical protein ACI970_000181, partial [Myxococcota bacterium]